LEQVFLEQFLLRLQSKLKFKVWNNNKKNQR